MKYKIKIKRSVPGRYSFKEWDRRVHEEGSMKLYVWVEKEGD